MKRRGTLFFTTTPLTRWGGGGNGSLDQEAVLELEDKLVCNFKLATDMSKGGVRKLVYDMDRSAVLKGF